MVPGKVLRITLGSHCFSAKIMMIIYLGRLYYVNNHWLQLNIIYYHHRNNVFHQNRRMKLKKELRAVKEINEQERKKRDEPGDDDHVGGDVDVDGGDVDIGDV